MEPNRSPLPYLVAISLMWGSAYLFLKISSADIPPLLLAALRAGIAIPILLVVCVTLRQFAIDRLVLRDMLVIGTLNGWLPNCLAALAITSISSAEAGVLQATTPIITGLLAAALLRDESLSVRTVLCLVGGFLGVVLVIASSGSAEKTGTLIGYLLMIGVAFSFGAGAVYARWAKPKAPALIASGQLVVAAGVALFASYLTGESWQLDWSNDLFFSVTMLGAFSTALPAVLFLVVISRYKAVKVGAASFLQPIWAIALGALFLSERISGLQLLGSLIIVFSVLLITTQFHSMRQTHPKRGT
ncbi:DMT family transporter [Cognatiyoonia sp. IB215446]|uniref:DMT family transporter n=1 Tax=Cognatiyoonia sp. IB215446 TaxID=3097355 RepID=UPI002A10C0CB|nr:DMT family transporter [Cognatiyoonia sp. IB215446]MDX8350684.1 DMT family transporter [Cognatiyoonia sp. IB215446]